MNNIFIIGAGGHASSCIDVIESQKKYKIAGLVSNSISNNTKYKILCKDNEIEKKFKKIKFAFIGIGQIKTPNLRIKFFKRLKKNFSLPKIISPNSYISRQSYIDEGTIILHQSILNTNVRIGKNCIINTKSLIEHDVSIDDHCHISTGAILNGNVKIGSGSFIGSGAIIHEGVEIGKNCIVAAGKIVKRNIPNKKILSL